MKSMTSYFKISLGVVRDDIRRFWAVPVIGFIFYFLGTLLYIFIGMANGNSRSLFWFVQSALSGTYFPNTLNILWMSILSVLLVFRYLHNSGHVATVHSGPFTRATLLNSHAISSILFVALPIIATGLILLIIARPLYYEDYHGIITGEINIFARANILRWMLQSLVTALFVVVVSIIASMVTGAPFHNATTAIGLNFIVPFGMWVSTYYFNEYIFGYREADSYWNIVTYTSPVIRAISRGYFSVGIYIFFIVIIILLYLLSMLLYHKRKLERATNGMVFGAMEIIIEMIFGYIGMTMLGVSFNAMFDGSEFCTALGYAIGGSLAIIIVKMIIRKTVKVFNRKTMITIGCFLLAAFAFISILKFDLIGSARCIKKDADNIEVYISLDTPDDRLNGGDYDSELGKECAIALHQMIIEHRDELLEYEDSSYSSSSYESNEIIATVYIDYYKQEKTVLRRRYSVPANILLYSEQMKQIVECQESRDDILSELPNIEDIKYILMGFSNKYTGLNDVASVDDIYSIESLYDAIRKDYSETTYESIREAYDLYVANRENYVERNVTIVYNKVEQHDDTLYNDTEYDKKYERDSNHFVEMNTSFHNTITWLEENVYGWRL